MMRFHRSHALLPAFLITVMLAQPLVCLATELGGYRSQTTDYSTGANRGNGQALLNALNNSQSHSHTTGSKSTPAMAHVSIEEYQRPLYQKRLTSPMVLQLHTSHNSLTSHAGEPFSASLPVASCYKGSCIPAGTRIHGYVEKVLPSRKLHRPGFVDVQMTQIQTPDGHVQRFGKASRSRRLHLTSPDAYTVKRQLLDEVPSVLGATAVVVPLALASSLTAGAIIPLGFAGAVIASGIQEGIQHKRGRSKGSLETKVGRSVMRGTVAPYVAYKASKRSPSVSVQAGDRIAFKPSRAFAKALYQR